MSMPSLPRTSYARKTKGLTFTDGTRGRDASHHRDRLDLDHPVGVRKGGDAHQRRGRPLLAEELLPDGDELGTAADIGEIGVDLHDVLHRAAAGFDLRLDSLKNGARLRDEVSRVTRIALV